MCLGRFRHSAARRAPWARGGAAGAGAGAAGAGAAAAVAGGTSAAAAEAEPGAPTGAAPGYSWRARLAPWLRLPQGAAAWQRALACLVLAAALTVPLGLALPHVNVVTSDSIDHRLFWLSAPGEFRSGDYLVFELVHPIVNGGQPVLVTKKVGCGPGEHLTIAATERTVLCAGRYLGHAKTTSLKGQPMPLFVWDSPVPAGQLFVSGSGRDSFDSRYFGFVAASEARFRATPLLLALGQGVARAAKEMPVWLNSMFY